MLSAPAPENVAHMLDAAKTALDDEIALAERLDNKARGAAMLAGSWFAVTQAVAATSLTAHTSSGWIFGCVCGLALQAIALTLMLTSIVGSIIRLRILAF
jgi:hypothetical protein